METIQTIQKNVRDLYETYPYPHYPLFLPLKWQEGYLTSSHFSAALFESIFNQPAAVTHQLEMSGHRNILLAGCGETLPYIIRKHEPSSHKVLCVDISHNSLRRARLRLLKHIFSKTEFIHDTLEHFLLNYNEFFHHIDSYGVLHHLANPSATLNALAEKLHPLGHMRIMVYNNSARRWIQHLQRAFQLLKLSAYDKNDLTLAHKLLTVLDDHSPALNQKLHHMQASLKSDHRFVDTFFHSREAHINIDHWFEIIKAAGLKVFGLFDRYGELDDLHNPLWQPPTKELLQQKAETSLYLNNLELFLCHKHIENSCSRKKLAHQPRMFPWARFLKGPPQLWFTFEETHDLSSYKKSWLWYQHLKTTSANPHYLDNTIKHFNIDTLKRLARLGAIFPMQIKDQSLLAELKKPLSTANSTTRDDVVPSSSLKTGQAFIEYIKSILITKNCFSEKRLQCIIQRIDESQKC